MSRKYYGCHYEAFKKAIKRHGKLGPNLFFGENPS